MKPTRMQQQSVRRNIGAYVTLSDGVLRYVTLTYPNNGENMMHIDGTYWFISEKDLDDYRDANGEVSPKEGLVALANLILKLSIEHKQEVAPWRSLTPST